MNGMGLDDPGRSNPTIIKDVRPIADALAIITRRGDNWDEAARNLIEGVTLHFATCPGYHNR